MSEIEHGPPPIIHKTSPEVQQELWAEHVKYLSGYVDIEQLPSADDYLVSFQVPATGVGVRQDTKRITHRVSFEDPQHAIDVEALLADGWTFTEACTKLRLRPIVHYTITRIEKVPES